jgi:hypothetical protein
MKTFIFIFLLIITLSKINTQEYGKEIIFDKNIDGIRLNFPEDGAILIYVKVNYSDLVTVDTLRKSKLIQKPGVGLLDTFESGRNNYVRLTYRDSSNEKGIVWILPSTYEIKVNLNETYQWEYDIKQSCLDSKKLPYKFTYSIDNAEKDVILQFKYNDKFQIDNGLVADNPLSICHGEQCQNDTTTYKIKKGESYKLYINVKNFKSDYWYFYLPSFSFNFINLVNDSSKDPIGYSKDPVSYLNKKNIIFIIVAILLVVLIGVTISKLCGKKEKEKIKENINQFFKKTETIKFELDYIDGNENQDNI